MAGFMQQLKAQSRQNSLTTVLTIHTPAGEGRANNTLVRLRGGEVIAHYHKLHLYDAFSHAGVKARRCRTCIAAVELKSPVSRSG
ncbi:Uncharacterised protein [Kluyvera cryocrescens]|uniref:Uncharacterized protein n=1 Tax=Kluyvera cryocrescens TaxID=580 RepID=A0A485CK79_KLUCR|nr:Uncharacterised protein [Kluyvera cryocrescens]